MKGLELMPSPDDDSGQRNGGDDYEIPLFRRENAAATAFDSILGYNDIKDIVKRVIDAEDNHNLLFIGPPTSAKTLFLLGTKKGATQQTEY